jgi:hypothetical protein
LINILTNSNVAQATIPKHPTANKKGIDKNFKNISYQYNINISGNQVLLNLCADAYHYPNYKDTYIPLPRLK